MKVKIEKEQDIDDDEGEEYQVAKNRKLHPMAFSVFIIPVGCVLTYMFLNEELAVSGYILSICAGITGIVLYFTLFLTNEEQQQDQIKDEFESLTIEEAFAQLQMITVDAQETLLVMNILRKKISVAQKMKEKQRIREKKLQLKKGGSYVAANEDKESLEVGLAKMGVVQHIIQILQTCETVLDKRVGSGLELINSIISDTKARDTLFDTADNLRDVIDSYVDLIKRLLTKVPESPMLNTPAAEKRRLKYGVVASIALTLMSMYCPMAQTRVGDRGGLYFMYQFLCEKDHIHHIPLAQWTMCCFMTLTTDHPPNKGEFFRLGGMTLIGTYLQSNYHTHLELLRYSLKLLHNILMDDIKATYSVAKARQICVQQINMTDSILHIQRKHNNDPHVITITSAVLKLIASNFS